MTSQFSQPTNKNSKSGDKKEEEHIITVMLVDDHKMVRQSMKKIINVHPEIKVLGTACNGKEAIKMARKTFPEVILMDINMPIMDGIEATKKIKAIMPEVCIIGLSLHDSSEVIDSMKRAGASAYVAKGMGAKILFDVIQKEIRQKKE